MGSLAVYSCHHAPIVHAAHSLYLASVPSDPVALKDRGDLMIAAKKLLLHHPLVKKLISIWHIGIDTSAAAARKIAVPSHLIPFMRATVSALDMTLSSLSSSSSFCIFCAFPEYILADLNVSFTFRQPSS